MSDDAATRRLHVTLEQHLDLRDGEVLAGWIVIYETTTFDERDPVVGHHYGPDGMTAWRALGLLDWTTQMLGPDDDGDQEDDDE